MCGSQEKMKTELVKGTNLVLMKMGNVIEKALEMS